MRNFHEFFRKDWIYENIDNHKEPELHAFYEIYIFGKITGGWVQIEIKPKSPFPVVNRQKF